MEGNTRKYSGRSQLSVVEHALCPIVPTDGPFTHEAEYFYFRNGNRKRAKATVECPLGLKPTDEFYLYTLLGLIFSNSEPELDFYAGPRFILNALGIQSIGGKSVSLLRSALHRLAAVSYRNESFYDPLRKEIRDVTFGLLSCDLPKKHESVRPWHLAIDPIYFKFCQAAGGFLSFDRDAYRSLRPASRRLYLLTQKLLYNREQSGQFDVKHLCVNQIGFGQGLRRGDYKKKLLRCVADLVELGVLSQSSVVDYRIRFVRGPRFGAQSVLNPETDCSMVPGLLQSIEGLNPACFGALVKSQPKERIYEWVDATVWAREKFGREYFTKSEAAFFYEGVTSGRRPPEWYFESATSRERSTSGEVQSCLGSLGFVDRQVGFDEWIRGDGRADLDRYIDMLGSRQKAVHYLRRRFESVESNRVRSLQDSFTP